ncbi:MAG: T9SS type A sorting domain-containing protein [Bacteroidota bacterium]
MKHFNPYLLFFLFLITGATQAQVINNQINYAVRTGDLYADNDWNIFGSDRIAMLIDVYDYTNFNDWLGAECVPFTVNGSGTITNDHRLIAQVFSADYNTQLTFDLEAWGESTTPNSCNYDLADFLPKYLVADEDGFQDKFTIWNVGRAAQWSDDWSSQANNWLYGDDNYDAKMETIWRYASGDRENDPLQFGTLTSSQPGVIDENSNRRQPSDFDPGQVLFGYENRAYKPGPDVFYTFTLSSRGEVRISTNWAITNFDTHLTLKGPSGIIAENDDVTPGNLNSQITETLCAGTYTVVVEGLNINDVGDYRLTIDLLNPGQPFTFGESISPTSCPDTEDGSVTLTPMNGVSPYSVAWSDGESGPFLTRNNMASGNYEVTITDACGTSISKLIFIPDDDTIPPTASANDISVEVPEGGTYVVDAALIGANSTDNCGIVSYTASPATIGASNAITNVFITVTDAAGNSDSELAVVTTSIIESQAGELCSNAESVDYLFGGPENVPQTSSLLSNIGYNSDGDPEENCFQFDGIDAGRWFSFTGDGNAYRIAVPTCGGENPMENDDTQIIVYEGSCSGLTQVGCNDDETGTSFAAGLAINTTNGQVYSILIDGYGGGFSGGGQGNPEGEFCLEVTNLGVSSLRYTETLNVELFPNPASDQVTLQFGRLQLSNQAQIFIRDLNGRPVWQAAPQGTQMTIPTDHLPAGTYIVELRDAGQLGRRRLIIQ